MPENDELERYLESVGNQPHLTAAEEWTAAKRAAAGDKEAEKLLVQSCLRLVVQVARRYEASGLPLLDLIQEGNLGLLHAVESFDPSKGFRFSVHAAWWIRHAITRGIASAGGAVTTAHVVEVDRVQRAWDDWVASTARQPSVDELAGVLGMLPDDLVDLLGTAPPT